jgi:alpha-D-ribose 1-methylphosphonate 5-triphosphate synthase subunit PhnI
MALVQVPPTQARVRWDRAANRPAEVSAGSHRLHVTELDNVRDERAAYPAGRGPRLTMVVRTREGGRAALAYDGRRWFLEAIEAAA